MRKLNSRDDCLVLNSDRMVRFIPLLEPTQYRDRIFHRGFINQNLLETPFKRFVLLKILLVLIEGSSTDCAQLPTRQRRLQYIRSIHGTLTATRTYERVNLIDEEYNFPLRCDHLIDHSFEALLKLPLVLGTRDQGPHVERKDSFTL